MAIKNLKDQLKFLENCLKLCIQLKKNDIIHRLEFKTKYGLDFGQFRAHKPRLVNHSSPESSTLQFEAHLFAPWYVHATSRWCWELQWHACIIWKLHECIPDVLVTLPGNMGMLVTPRNELNCFNSGMFWGLGVWMPSGSWTLNWAFPFYAQP